ncbi:phage tail assembly chaperone [bacterium]|nr:phage tail assembly chaperone [bacterium]
MTSDQQTKYDAEVKSFEDGAVNRKLNYIKGFRLERLQATDYMANSDVTMPDYIKTWRQALRDLPANHTDEDAYDLLLARDSDGKLTHSVWTQPTS